MDWEEADRHCTELRRRAEEGEDVFDEIRDFEAGLSAASQDLELPPEGEARRIGLKAAAIRDSLTLGPIALPEGADEELARFADRIRGRVLSTPLNDEINAFLESYREEARAAGERIIDLRAQHAALSSRRDLLLAYLELLEALTGRGAAAGPNPPLPNTEEETP